METSFPDRPIDDLKKQAKQISGEFVNSFSIAQGIASIYSVYICNNVNNDKYI